MRTLLCCLLVASLLTSCTRQHVSPPASSPPVPGRRIQYGLASWYGRLITVATLTALYRTDELRGHIRRALQNGVTRMKSAA